ncbi:MAG TPA: CYTH domain-containing protein [Sedimenticola thiotaurini]|uniref:CYTH domain-containing protein n=1 Tax=Sedimenticola thiotaurini TaxID=1543721 RepID=A0A831RP89_9GAMM|nr:CYTH domain-containing protein [Sedimenticola thiotaurini]
MAIEIERKFLVTGDGWRDQVIGQDRLKQGYLCNRENATVRVRVGGGRALLNIKSATTGIRRAEYEYEIPLQEGEELLRTMARQPVIDKTRYRVRHGGHVWELDVFEGANRGLVIAEVELASEDEPFERPEWAGEEVSGDPRYYNASLIEHPYREWSQ